MAATSKCIAGNTSQIFVVLVMSSNNGLVGFIEPHSVN